uniref:Interferon regulatory factor like protein n=1 Tax=Phallusia mammillata TaxID=59560 RepID=A0A6F9DFB4_9ASCI|nr:interferon regulatory factor like protein [Phallusia mammillata]
MNSSLMELESEQGLTMRHWLLRRLKNKDIPNLIWDPDDSSLIRIPWNKQGECSQAEEKLFKLWAERNGKMVDPDTKKSKLKDNFRNALHKSNDFQEMEHLHKLDQQSNNYRVYKLLNPSESKAKARRVKEAKERKKSDQGSIKQSPAYSNFSPVASESVATVQDPTPNPENQLMEDMELATNIQFEEADVTQLVSNMSFKTQGVSELIPQTSYSCNDYQQHPTLPQDHTSQNQLPFCEMQTNSFQQMNDLPKVHQNLNAFGLGININALTLYTVQLFYSNVLVKRWFIDFKEAHRLLYGKDVHQVFDLTLTTLGNVPEEFKTSALEFPTYEGKDPNVKQTLEAADQGIILQADTDGNLYGTRLCEVRVYHFDQDSNSKKPVKLERKQSTKLFSYETYIQDLCKSKDDKDTPEPECKKRLFYGVVPISSESCGVVTLTIMPEVVAPIRDRVLGNQSTLIALSDQNSIDQAIRDIANKKSMS